MGTFTIIAAIAGLAFGLIGAVLGILNTKRALDRDKVKLKVTPIWCFISNGNQEFSLFAIEVINQSQFAVTVTGVGFTMPGDKVFAILPQLSSGGSLPQRMESRAAITAYCPQGIEHDPRMGQVLKGFARTACGGIFEGDSKALRGVVMELNSVRGSLS